MPGRETWNLILTRGEDQKLCAKIAAIREMEQAGAEVLTFSADIASESSLKPVLDELRQKFGQINGIIHAAGVAGAGVMLRKDIQSFKNVVSPKIEGTWLLDKLTGADDLDFFILFSSVVTLTGAPGQSDYTAANSYLDSFASYRNKQGKRTISIDWPVWEGIGIASVYTVNDEHLAFKTITGAKALNTFEEVLTEAPDAKFSRVIYGELNYKFFAILEYEPFKLAEQISAAINKQTAQFTKNKLASSERVFKKATVIGLSSQNEEQTAYILAQIWGQVIGLDEIDVNLSIYEQGADSILASQLLREIDAEYPDILSTEDLFKHSTINELAKVIDQKGGAAKRKELMLARTLDAAQQNLENTKSRQDQEIPFEALEAVKAKTLKILEAKLDNQGSAADEVKETKVFPDIHRIENLWPVVKMYQRDEPDAKELILNLQREITIALHRCLPLQVILSDDRLQPWYYEHFVNIFSQIQGDGLLKLDYLEEWGNYRHLINEVSLSATFMAEQKDIIDFIINNINQGNYLNISVDEYFLPHKLRSERTHFIHHELVYGYDNHKRELKTIGFNDEKLIDILTFTYDEFRDAYEKGKEFYQESAPWTSHVAVQLLYSNGFDRPYPFRMKFFLDKLNSYLRSTKEKEIVYYWSLKDERVEYGFKVHDVVLEYLEKLLQGITLMDYRALHLLYEHKNGLAKRFAYIIKRYGITGKMIQLNDLYLNVVEHFKAIRLKFMDLENKFGFRALEPEEIEYAKGQLEPIIEMLKLGKEKEYPILMEIYEILNSLQLTED
jgi:hypothetical protein